MKTIQFKCPYCGQTYEGSASDIGAEAECEECGQTFRIAASTSEIVKFRPTGFGCYLAIFKKYFGFKGRTDRRTFWWAVLFHFVALFLSGVADGFLFDESDDHKNLVSGIFVLATLLPMLAVQTRRLHDTGKSGWWFFLIMLPPLNIAYCIWLAQKGDADENRFGRPAS